MSWEERRKDRRVLTVVPTLIFGDLCHVKGHTVNLSTGGCALAGAQRLEKGQHLGLVLQAPKPCAPIKIQLAVITWSVLGLCGVEFIRVSDEDQKNLRHYLYMINLCPTLGTQGQRAGSAEEPPQPQLHAMA